ncbi:16S rRNA (uracil(1498)-N(3))-methyltransferase [Prochlorococcus sp. MIT 1341]|uniref:16S rRNA (uracil(1498)-N(3))-methyltransferase n=1 Tax=Prochlorococcus sp. MIT 1341 TaxID=3096221 RepID=UPI002A757CA6|nr:16S rRNA (uracil(1498)-N(3))-methyltransferase [Prochlorococcus sp. MIT 1341]
MSESRRLLIEPIRLKSIKASTRELQLNSQEIHYLYRVLRLRKGSIINIVDGLGNLWEAVFQEKKTVLFLTAIDAPIIHIPRTKPKLGLAVVVPKRGFDDILRMSCELGIDIVQPLNSDRSNPSYIDRQSRWNSIIREAVEQSERLWQPDLLSQSKATDWLKCCGKRFPIAFAQTRISGLKELVSWLDNLEDSIEQAWVVIGPEGGWSASEVSLVESLGLESVEFSDQILTTSTAAIAATQIMVGWRRIELKNLK